MSFSSNNFAVINIFIERMQARNWLDGVTLLHQAIAKAEVERDFCDQLQALFNDYSTISARTVFDFFLAVCKTLNMRMPLMLLMPLFATFGTLKTVVQNQLCPKIAYYSIPVMAFVNLPL